KPSSPLKLTSPEISRKGVGFTVREGRLMILICPDCCTTKSRLVSPGGAVTKTGAVKPPATRAASRRRACACADEGKTITSSAAKAQTQKVHGNIFEKMLSIFASFDTSNARRTNNGCMESFCLRTTVAANRTVLV